MEKNQIVVIGSSNTDMVVQSDHLPAPGETVLGGKFLMNPGGKGANQAVAAAKLGGDVTLIAKVGNDIFGKEAIESFKAHGINTEHIYADQDTASGVALIMVDAHGENCISVALGANETLTKDEINDSIEVIAKADFLLAQLETPLDVISHAVKIAYENGVKMILNPAPAQELPDDLLQRLYMITPNQSEAELLSGVQVVDASSAQKAAKVLRGKGVQNVMITMGAQGAYVYTGELNQLVPARKVKAVDSTAAGDTFNGALVVALSEGMSILKAIEFANKAAAYSVTRMGAQSSTPLRRDITAY